jgi:hypothetical protein
VRWALGAAVALLAAAIAVGVILIRTPSGGARPSILVALVNGPKVDCLETRVVRADRETLMPIESRAVRVRGAFEQPVYSPDRRFVALGGDSGTVIVVDAKQMRLAGSVRVGPSGDDVRVIAWPAPARLVAVSYTARVSRPYVTRLVAVDPRRARVIAARALASVDASGRAATQTGRVPLLIVSRRELAPPKLVVVGAQGRMATVTLSRLRAGTAGTGRFRIPGFAVDPAEERAFVVSPRGLVATVQLATLSVRYRVVKGLASKGSHALWRRGRQATWLGDGRIAVSGSDSSLAPLYGSANPDLETPRGSFASFGLRLLDTRRWTVRTLDPRPSTFEWISGRLIAYGRDSDARHVRGADQTVIAFDRSGHSAYTIEGDRNTYWQAFDGRLFFFDGRSRRFEVRDARDGRVLGHEEAESLRSLGPC